MSRQTIQVYVDDGCEMAKVKVNNVLVMEGNFWDFHPGCHGINQYGDFNTYTELVQALFLHLRKVKPNDKIEIAKFKYKYQ